MDSSSAVRSRLRAGGASFEHRATVGATEDANENWMLRLTGRRIMLVFRTNPKPLPNPKGYPEGGLCQTFSSNDGYNWSTPTLMTGGTGPSEMSHRVEPKLVRFPAIGAVVLSSGRMGHYLYYVRESDLKPGHEADAKWDSWDVQAHHDAALSDLPEWHFKSCGMGATYYTSITVLGEDNMVLSSDHLPEQGCTCPRLDSVFTVKLRLAPAATDASIIKSDDDDVQNTDDEQPSPTTAACAVLDISAPSTTQLQVAVRQARKKKATSPKKCVNIMLGSRSFLLPTPLELAEEDRGTRLIGGELTADGEFSLP